MRKHAMCPTCHNTKKGDTIYRCKNEKCKRIFCDGCKKQQMFSVRTRCPNCDTPIGTFPEVLGKIG